MAMKVIVVDGRKLDDFGIGRYLQGLLTALSCRDDPWSFVVPCRSARSAWVEALGPRFRPLPSSLPLYSFAELSGFRAILAGLQPELFHAPHYVLPFGLPCPAVVTIHDPIHLLFPAWLSRPGRYPYARLMMASVVRRARRLITVSEAAAADIRRCLHRSELALDVIPNGGGEEHSGPRPASLDRPPFLLFVGNPMPHKNLDGLLAAYARYRARRAAPLDLVVVGGKRRAAAAGGTRYLGRVSDQELSSLYRAAHAVVIPSLYEGFGLVLLEALAAGVPALASDLPALRELAGESALFTDPKSEAALAEGLERIAGDQVLRARLNRDGPKRARLYTWERSAEVHARLYAEILGLW
jgi:alpha-1,3-rhamnosyl/mannosyltransferase